LSLNFVEKPRQHYGVACVFRLVQTQNLPDQNVALILSEYLTWRINNLKFMSQPKKAAVYFILITVLIDVIGFGIIIPVLPKLLEDMLGIGVNEASTYGGILLSVWAVAQFICSPIIGNLSDQYGRRPVLLLALFGLAIDYLIMAFAPDFTWLVIGRIIAGIGGASFSTASAYIADVSDESNRAKNFGMIGAAFGLGFIIGPLLGGVFGEIGVRVPFYVAAGLAFTNFLYGYFILPESLPEEKRRPFSWARANPVGTLRELFNIKGIGYLLVAFFLLNLASHAVNSNWAYFTIYRFEWSEFMVGLSLAAAGVLVAIVQGGFAQKAYDYFGAGKSVYLGIAMYGIGMLLFAFATESWMMFAFLVPFAIGGICTPNLQSYLSGRVGEDQQGELQGGLTAIQSLTTIFGPLIMTSIFFYTTKAGTAFYFPGSAFLLAAVLVVGSFTIAYSLLKN
jgi:DHA1 family tetracycline resistance protein-like MFS transporter